MEKLELTQMIYSDPGTLEVSLFNSGYHLFSVTKYKQNYQLCYDDAGHDCKIIVDSDLVESPKQLDVCDWQLLKILHPEVQEYQWKIFQTLKDFVDNRTEGEYSLQRIKSILQKENKIESI